MIYKYPLLWPVGVPRTVTARRARFDTSDTHARRNLENELRLLGATQIVITTNIEFRRDGRPYANQYLQDMGVAVYFTRKGNRQAMACDRWSRVGDNFQALAKTVEALRGIERWGTGEMVDAAFRGFAALPATASAGTPVERPRLWHEVLGVTPDAPREVIEAAKTAMQKKTHPDNGGNQADFEEVMRAYGEATR